MLKELEPAWEKLRTYQFDDPSAILTFTRRLMRENDWEEAYARRVIEEYRRFMFLCLYAGYSVTPSDQVDQAWHLHLLYSEEYFDNFCSNYLGQVVHHQPTLGGVRENGKFYQWYSRTLDQVSALTVTVNAPDDVPNINAYLDYLYALYLPVVLRSAP